MEFSPGRLARSRAGRDRGKVYVVVGTISDRYVMVADGDTRKMSNPKKKNIYHLVPMDYVAYNIRDKLLRSEVPTDEEVRCAVRMYTREYGKEEQ
ncbi:MAG TPA: RNA-binding protein [Firmicutes bacterium]|nr:RNA-binding protein [Bacillota bacterium]HHY98455.1 RNA-binding protein [Bacillota bacterium]